MLCLTDIASLHTSTAHNKHIANGIARQNQNKKSHTNNS